MDTLSRRDAGGRWSTRGGYFGPTVGRTMIQDTLSSQRHRMTTDRPLLCEVNRLG